MNSKKYSFPYHSPRLYLELHHLGRSFIGDHGWLELMLVCSMESMQLEGCKKKSFFLLSGQKREMGRWENGDLACNAF